MKISAKYTLIILTVVFIFIGCNKNATRYDQISFFNVPTCESKDLISEVEIIPLTFSDSNYPKNIKNFYVFKDKTIVQDIRNYIFIFDSNGLPLSNSIGKVGNGPGGYLLRKVLSPQSQCRIIVFINPGTLSYSRRPICLNISIV